MAFSLEAAIVVPLVIGSWLGLVQLAAPAYSQVYQAARLEVQSTADNLSGNCLYRVTCNQDGSAWTTSLQTSPQEVIELVSLIVDDCRLVFR